VFQADINRAVTNGVLNVYRMNTSSWGGITQNMSFNAATGQALEASWRMGNSSATAKTVRLYLNSATGGFTGSLTCLYTVPANTPLTQYRLIGPVGSGWSGTGVAFQIVFQTADNQAALQVDDVIVRHYTTNPGVSATNCAWNGVLGVSQAEGMIVGTPMQLPGIPDGLVPLPPPMGVVPTPTLSPSPAPSLPPLPTASLEPTLTPTFEPPTDASPTVTPTAAAPTAESTPAL
jgi:hypothetical protein